MNNWIRTAEKMPPKGEVVETKIDDNQGDRMHQKLKLGGMNGLLWFFPDSSMYVYYTPTHWRPSPSNPTIHDTRTTSRHLKPSIKKQ